MVVVLTSCGTTFDERRPDPLPVRPTAPPAPSTVVIPGRPDRSPVFITEEELRAFMAKTARSLPLANPAGAIQAPLRVVPTLGEPLDVASLAMAEQYVAWCGARGRGRDCAGALRGNSNQ